jgi:rod shape-determining protein MreC
VEGEVSLSADLNKLDDICMFTVRRWWERNGTRALLIGASLGLALYVRQTQGAFLLEAYQLLSRPFQGNPQKQQQIENAQMVELQQRLVELQNRNQRLEELMGFNQTQKTQVISAPVTGRSADHWWSHLMLGRGKADGVEINSVVMGPGGVIGRVSKVSEHGSLVVLLSDAFNQVGVTVSRTRATGFVKGQSGEKAGSQVVMAFFDKNVDVRKGDTVVTSAFSKKFPAGLPVGRVESVDMTKSPAPEAIIQLTAPIASLEWASIMPHMPPVVEDLQPEPNPQVAPDAKTGQP